MKKALVLCTLIASFILSGQRAAHAQGGGLVNPYRYRPPTSPYLNLFRGDADPGFNYHRLVRPEQDFRAFDAAHRSSFRQLQRGIAAQRAFDESEALPTLGGGGHPTYFMNHFNYFPRRRGGAGRSRGFSRNALNRNPSRGSRGRGGAGRIPSSRGIRPF